MQLLATDKRVVDEVEDSEMEDVHKESQRAKTIGGMEVCVLDDGYDEWHDERGLLLEDQEGTEEGDADRRNVPEHIHRMPFCPPAGEGLISEKQVYATRAGEPLCHDAVRKARAKEPKHTQDQKVFEVVWLSEVESLTKVRSRWLRDMTEDAVKVSFVAQQVAFAAVGQALLALAASRNQKVHRIV